jgi:thiamine kinase-like enzyme
MSVIEDAVAKIEDWQGKNVSIEPLSGGLTNTNYKVTVDGTPFFCARSGGKH